MQSCNFSIQSNEILYEYHNIQILLELFQRLKPFKDRHLFLLRILSIGTQHIFESMFTKFFLLFIWILWHARVIYSYMFSRASPTLCPVCFIISFFPCCFQSFHFAAVSLFLVKHTFFAANFDYLFVFIFVFFVYTFVFVVPLSSDPIIIKSHWIHFVGKKNDLTNNIYRR